MTSEELTRAPVGVDRLLAKSVRDVFAAYPQALVGEPRAVHALRIAVRRLRVTLAVLAAKPDGKRRRRVDRILRSFGRAVSGSRDLYVSAKLLEHYERPGPRDRQETAVLRRALAGRRARARRQSRDDLLDLELAALRIDLRAITARDPIEGETLRRRLRKLVDVEGAWLAKRLAVIGRRFQPEALHDVRRRARKLRYAAEIADAVFGENSGAPKALRKLQDLIGAIHDRHVFAAWLDERAARASRAGDEIHARTARLMRGRVLRDARSLHREYLAADPAAIATGALQAMRPEEPPSAGAVVLDFPEAGAGS